MYLLGIGERNVTLVTYVSYNYTPCLSLEDQMYFSMVKERLPQAYHHGRRIQSLST